MALTEKISRLLGRKEDPAPTRDSGAPEGSTSASSPDTAATTPAATTPAATTPAATVPAASSEPQPEAPPGTLRDRVIEVLKTVYDPEIPVDIYELGLVYEVAIRDQSNVFIQMTLTSPMCPVAEILPQEVEEKARSVDGVDEVSLDLVWDPPWNPDMMSEAAKLTLNF